MFPSSGKRNGELGKKPGPEVEREVTVLNLTVCGAPASIHAQRPKSLREYKSYRFVREEKREKDFAFPVDRIVYLAERLELTSSETEGKCVSLSAVDVATGSSPIYLPERECKPAKHSAPDASPGSPLSLDLSSITSTESDEGCPRLETETAPGCCSRSSGSVRSLRDVCATSRISSGRSQCFCQTTDRSRQRTSDTCCDLINLYVNSVDKNRELLKYFRPCHTCRESCCVRPHSLVRSDPDLTPANGEPPHFPNTTQMDVCDYLIPTISPSPLHTSRREHFQTHLRTPFEEECLCNCTIENASRTTEADSYASARNLAYTSSLANAARSARLLARDLELVLTSLRNDTE